MSEPEKNRMTSIVMLVVFAYLGLVLMKNCGKPSSGTPQTRASRTAGVSQIDYGMRVCDDAWEHEIDRRNDSISNFTVDLRSGCFSGFVSPPVHGAHGTTHLSVIRQDAGSRCGTSVKNQEGLTSDSNSQLISERQLQAISAFRGD
jgi:hypothetical protein